MQLMTGYQVTLRGVQRTDLEMLRQWRNDPDVRRFMVSQSEISAEQQQTWFDGLQGDATQAHFVIEYRDQAIGSANIRVADESASLAQAKIIEPGLYIADVRYRANILAFAPTLLLNDYCFETLGAERLKAKVKPDNQAALSYNEKLGYVIEDTADFVEISLKFEDYQRHSQSLKALLSRPSRRN